MQTRTATARRRLYTQLARDQRRRGSRDRASIIVLVVVMLVLMALMGVSYLQVARVQRREPAPPPNNLPVVYASIESLLAERMLDDIFGETTGVYFSANAADGIEPYDFPWTNRNVTSPSMNLDGQYTGANAVGGYSVGAFDDTWLSSGIPYIDGGGSPQWAKLTCLTGRIYNQTDPDSLVFTRRPHPGVAGSVTMQSAVYDPALHEPIAPYDARLGDANGDGVPDAFCERAPIPVIEGYEYFMWVQVVDLSSMLNANVAIGQTDASGVNPAAPATTSQVDYRPRSWFPTDLELSSFVVNRFGLPGSELQALLDRRDDATNPLTLPVPFITRANAYFDGVMMQGNTTLAAPFEPLVGGEAELRYRGGIIQNPSGSGPFSETMPTLMTAGENTDTDGVSSDAELLVFLQNNPRLYLTTRSAEADFAPALPTELFDTRIHRTDVNSAPLEPLRDNVNAVYAVGSPPTIPGLTAGDDSLGVQFAVNVRDYADDDFLVTVFADASGAVVRAGLEPLPFITEVLCQRQWAYDPTFDDGDATNGSPDPSWVLDTSTTTNEIIGFAIEIDNPWLYETELANIELFIAGVSQGTLDTIAGQATIAPDESIVLFGNATDGTGDGDIAALITGTPTTAINVGDATTGGTGTITWPEWAGTDARVELRCQIEDENGTDQGIAAWAYSYFDVTQPSTPIAQATPPVGTAAPYRVAGVGNGNGINTVVIDGTAFTADEDTPADFDAAATSYVPSLGAHDKTAAGPADAFAGPDQFVFNQSNFIGHVGEVAHLSLLGIDLSGAPAEATYAQQWGATTNGDAFRIRLDSTAPVVDSSDWNWNVPHGVFLINRLTTLGQLTDGRDNDGDGSTDIINDPSEQLVRGRININTASREVLLESLPIDDLALRTQIVDAIIAERNGPARDTNNIPTAAINGTRGIAHTAELYARLSPSLVGGGQVGDKPFVDSNGNGSFEAGEQWFDFLDNGDQGTPALADDRDAVGDDREEEMALINWVNQLGTTRSDVFVAYVMVKGYAVVGGQLSDTPVEVGRRAYLIDRSGLVDSLGNPDSGQVRITPLLDY